MKKNIIHSVIFFALVWIGALYSRQTGSYYSYEYTDVILHILSGIGFGYLALVLLQKESINNFQSFLFFSGISVIGSYLWELWEYGGWHLIPSDMPFYAPALGDSLGDIAAGLLGTTLLFIFVLYKQLAKRGY